MCGHACHAAASTADADPAGLQLVVTSPQAGAAAPSAADTRNLDTGSGKDKDNDNDKDKDSGDEFSQGDPPPNAAVAAWRWCKKQWKDRHQTYRQLQWWWADFHDSNKFQHLLVLWYLVSGRALLPVVRRAAV